MPGSKTYRWAAGAFGLLLATLTVAAGLHGQPAAAGKGAPAAPPSQVPPLAETGFQSMFDGRTLSGWDGDPDFWRVENGEIVGETRQDHQPKQNTFLVWRDGKPADFEMKMQYKLSGAQANSGLQYRSVELPEVARWVLKGYQADIDIAQTYTGQMYEERNRLSVPARTDFVYPRWRQGGLCRLHGRYERAEGLHQRRRLERNARNRAGQHSDSSD